MQRLLTGLFVFAVTLALGWSAVRLFVFANSAESAQPANPVGPDIAFSPSAPREFVPEFRDLPNFKDIEESEFKAKLIGFHGNEGIFRQSEVLARSGERWLGLYTIYHATKLEVITAKVTRLRSRSYPGDENDARVSFGQPRLPIFAVKDAPGLKPGFVVTVYPQDSWLRVAESESVVSGYRQAFELRGNRYMLRASTGVTEDGTETAVLVLEHDGRSQVIQQIYHVPTDGKDIFGTLVWAGDLDGDNQLDLYFDEYNEKGAFVVGLYLSSAANNGELVKQVATFVAAGC